MRRAVGEKNHLKSDPSEAWNRATFDSLGQNCVFFESTAWAFSRQFWTREKDGFYRYSSTHPPNRPSRWMFV